MHEIKVQTHFYLAVTWREMYMFLAEDEVYFSKVRICFSLFFSQLFLSSAISLYGVHTHLQNARISWCFIFSGNECHRVYYKYPFIEYLHIKHDWSILLSYYLFFSTVSKIDCNHRHTVIDNFIIKKLKGPRFWHY